MLQPTMAFLSPELVKKIIDEAYSVLSDTGIRIENSSMRERLIEKGARYDAAGGRLCIPPSLIDSSLDAAPREFSLYDTHGLETHRFSEDNIYFTPGSSALYFRDPSGETRKPDTADYIRYVKTTESLEYIQSQSTAFVPADIPNKAADSYRLFLSLAYGSKPVVTGTFSRHSIEVMLDMLQAVRGTAEMLKAEPLSIFTCCPNTPLMWTDDTCVTLEACCAAGVPVEIISVPMCGLISPVSLTGTLILHTAENLSGVVMAQTASPGTPLLYGCCAGIHDMRYSTMSMGAVESMLLSCGAARIGRSLSLPTQAYIAVSDSAATDMQAGAETGTGAVLAALAGINNISGPGLLDYLNCFSLEKLVFDNELCGTALRAAKGIQPRDDFPAGPLLDELLQETHLLLSAHTRRFLRDEHFFPGPLIDRRDAASRRRQPGSQAGRAFAEISRRLQAYTPPVLPDGCRRSLFELMTAQTAACGLDTLPLPPDWQDLPD